MNDQQTRERLEIAYWAFSNGVFDPTNEALPPMVSILGEDCEWRDFNPHTDLNACALVYPVLQKQRLLQVWLNTLVDASPTSAGLHGKAYVLALSTAKQITDAVLTVIRNNPNE